MYYKVFLPYCEQPGYILSSLPYTLFLLLLTKAGSCYSSKKSILPLERKLEILEKGVKGSLQTWQEGGVVRGGGGGGGGALK